MTTSTLSPPENIQLTLLPLKIKTNLNGKLANDFFCHIKIAGKTGLLESAAETTQVRFITEDDSHPPILAQVIDSFHQELGEISTLFTHMSHAMDRDDFIENTLSLVKGATRQTMMTIFFYKKIHN